MNKEEGLIKADALKYNNGLNRNRRVRSRKACERCHKKKIKCNFQHPCDKCKNSNLAYECFYSVVKKEKYVTIKKDYVENLELELRDLRSKLALNEEKLVQNVNYIAESPSLRTRIIKKQNEAINAVPLKTDPDGNPLVIDQKLPYTTQKSRFIHMGDSACSKFNIKLQQYVLTHKGSETFNQYNFNKLHQFLHYDDEDLVWNNSFINTYCILPDKKTAKELAYVAENYVGIEYYFVMFDSFNLLIDKIYENNEPGTAYTPNNEVSRIQMVQFFAMMALGELYKNEIMPDGRSPGIDYFKYAISLLQDQFEQPTVEYVEALTQIGYYSYSLNRVNSAFMYASLAIRISMLLGLHRKASLSNNSDLDVKEKERRRRLWWTVFIFDRMIASKLGHPYGISVEDIDTELPSEKFFTESEYKEFPESKYMLGQIQIAKISSLILKKIYSINEQSNNRDTSFVENVHEVLTELRDCYNNLDPTLRLQYYKNKSTSKILRNIYSFHNHYNQLIILSTRSLFLYVFINAISDVNFVPSPTSLAISEACIRSAYSINSAINSLYDNDKIAKYGGFDAQYCFSSTVIILMSATVTKFSERTKMEITSRISRSIQVLKYLSSVGSISARHFYDELNNLEISFKQIDIHKTAKVFKKFHNDDGDPLDWDEALCVPSMDFCNPTDFSTVNSVPTKFLMGGLNIMNTDRNTSLMDMKYDKDFFSALSNMDGILNFDGNYALDDEDIQQFLQ
ncbi:hypothetical protein PACTADRAFT_51759 [Pachysolen tannophilus NRRL Y-2460]|uniref:Zn(2)-C6 fungal-type domain-containing protein n=1 Tax=Pachysolen tannophilus NRRL Y-2460 TaxID=669874 RepID=A0A1E4TN15_PACTA|nr:hypothetical protein PACTADRAFT_51759 [Pachysolen tannophilus NRRL Y-2460]